MGYRHLTAKELNELCDEWEVLHNLREAVRQTHAADKVRNGPAAFDCADDFHLSSFYYYNKRNEVLRPSQSHSAVFWSAQRDFHATARTPAGLRPYD